MNKYREAINNLANIVVAANEECIKDMYEDDVDLDRATFGTDSGTAGTILQDLFEDVAKRVLELQAPQKKLYTWTWVTGGYNQHYAYSVEEAIEYGNSMCDLVINLTTLKHEPNDVAYWNDLPLMD